MNGKDSSACTGGAAQPATISKAIDSAMSLDMAFPPYSGLLIGSVCLLPSGR